MELRTSHAAGARTPTLPRTTMPRPPWVPTRSVTLLATALLCCACASSEPWTFAASRAAYDEGGLASMAEGELDPAAACALAFFLVLPLAVDLAGLPITLPHDLYVHGLPG